jgi:hypothetical protein
MHVFYSSFPSSVLEGCLSALIKFSACKGNLTWSVHLRVVQIDYADDRFPLHGRSRFNGIFYCPHWLKDDRNAVNWCWYRKLKIFLLLTQLYAIQNIWMIFLTLLVVENFSFQTHFFLSFSMVTVCMVSMYCLMFQMWHSYTPRKMCWLFKNTLGWRFAMYGVCCSLCLLQPL